MNRLPHLFIILKPEFQGEGISLLPWSFNSLKMPLTQVVTMGTYSQLEKMEPPTISALSSSWCIFVFKIYFGTVQTQTTSRIHLSDFLKIKGVILAEKKTCSWNVKHLLQKQRKNTHGFWRSFNPKKNNNTSFSRKKQCFIPGLQPQHPKIIQPLQLDVSPFLNWKETTHPWDPPSPTYWAQGTQSFWHIRLFTSGEHAFGE